MQACLLVTWIAVTVIAVTENTPARLSGRRQADRRAETQARLLDATVDCLAELGWSGTSTTEVARRARVSRGAQQHYYRTKLDLVTAAVEHLVRRQQAEFERAFTALPPSGRTGAAALDLLWSVFCSRSFRAMAELLNAARTDKALREPCAGLTERVVRVTEETFGRLFGGPEKLPNPELVPIALRGLLALFTGLALQNGVDDDAGGHQAEVIGSIKQLAKLLVPERSRG